MSRVVNEWIQLNREARRICAEALDRLVAIAPEDPVAQICAAHLHKATDTLNAVNILYAHQLQEPAQALIRILFELRINFDCFLRLVREDPREAVERVVACMMLEKVKQARAADFAGVPPELRANLETFEAEMAEKYPRDEFERMRRHGFTGVSIEQRADLTGHGPAYAIVYRNFSRNIHSTDYVESYRKTGIHTSAQDETYLNSRDTVAHYTAHFSATGILEYANGVFGLGMDREITHLGRRQAEIQALRDEERKAKSPAHPGAA